MKSGKTYHALELKEENNICGGWMRRLQNIEELNERILFFIPTKQNYSKHVERIEMWKKMQEGEEA